MIEQSENQIESVDWNEISRYLAITLSKEEIEKEGLQHVLPKRKNNNNRKVSVAYLSNKKNTENWTTARTPGHRQKKEDDSIGSYNRNQSLYGEPPIMVGDTT